MFNTVQPAARNFFVLFSLMFPLILSFFFSYTILNMFYWYVAAARFLDAHVRKATKVLGSKVVVGKEFRFDQYCS